MRRWDELLHEPVIHGYGESLPLPLPSAHQGFTIRKKCTPPPPQLGEGPKAQSKRAEVLRT